MGRKCCDECPGDETCPHNDVCMCGDEMQGHSSPFFCGHSPVSMHDYHSREPEDERSIGES